MPDELSHLSRAVGLDLWEASGQYDLSLVRDEAGIETLAVVGLVARSRAFLRAAFALTDDGYPLEAMVQVRALLEYAITLRWLMLDLPYHVARWAISDLEARARMDREVRELGGPEILTDETRARDAELIVTLTARCGDRPTGLPNLKLRAKSAGMGLFYSLMYRADSQAAAHPTMWAVDQFMERREGGVAVHSRPAPGRPTTDPYKAGAVVFTAILAAAAEAADDDALAQRVDETACRLPGFSAASGDPARIPVE